MEISYGTLEDALLEAFAVPQGRVAAFAARIKYFGRLGFPAAAKVGRGVRARYGLLDIVQVAIALELTDLGIPPVPMLGRVAAQQPLLRAALARLIHARRSNLQPALWNFGGGALSARTGAAGETPDGDPVFAELEPADLIEWTQEGRRRDLRTARSLVLVDPQRLLDALDDGFGRLDNQFSQWFREALVELIDGPHDVRT